MAMSTNAHDAGEMFQRGRTPSLFAARPQSAFTDFEDMWSDGGSDFEEDSPRGSLESSGAQSQTTVTSYNLPTPATEHNLPFGALRLQRQESIRGPRGPHLFRSSVDSSKDFVFQLSPLLPKEVSDHPELAVTPRPLPNLTPLVTSVNEHSVREWSSRQVAAWMHTSGFDDSVISRFEEHDINGAVLLDLQFEDLKELDIPSFGKRYQIWNELAVLRADGGMSPVRTPFEDTNSVRHNDFARPRPSRRGRRAKLPGSDPLAPGDSISIVAIEQHIPRPHKCSRGEDCPKWRKQQRLIDQLDEEYGWAISPGNGGHIFIAGDPGDVDGAQQDLDRRYRPTSDAIPSVVASSDLLGPGLPEDFTLQEDTLRNVASRDPQENVKQFLSFQHLQSPTTDQAPESPVTETPRYEMFPPLLAPSQQPPPLNNLRSLPKLSIPQKRQTMNQVPTRSMLSSSSELRRYGTPASEMDVPTAVVPLPPLDRDASQSVPPNMQFRAPIQRRPSSRAAQHSRRPSFMPTLPETTTELFGGAQAMTPLKPRVVQAEAVQYGDDTTQAGWMKKRKARLLKHEWNEHHFRLHGTQLAMHKTDSVQDTKPLDMINVHDYSVACSSLVHDSKLAAALKSLRITSGKKDDRIDEAAFAFSLIPSAERSKVLGMLREGAKSQHFAVKSRDDRIDWMRSIMLAKAKGQKETGCEVTINGQTM